MSSCINSAQEQLCYIPCNFCNIVLAVSVPCSNLLDIVTVRCGHCSNLWSVNMAAAFQSLSWKNSQASSHSHNGNAADYRVELGSSSKCNNKMKTRAPIQNNTNDDQRVINRPPEKKQRVPSAYNKFIKEEIQRIKANNPDITHREAFSTAAKNWAHYPHIQCLMLEANNLKTQKDGSEKHYMSVPGLHY
ncbi:axial regulator YABBY 5-like [Cucurbita moschata]|uniref:Axial regulator YABBY 5-like n=1 Tax=Cucurbita moschata TaxID=3662 RepID=A0A6J1FBX3_CUCMO|nr:axial regulator YABBY 5-like [Cucurbita moschata]